MTTEFDPAENYHKIMKGVSAIVKEPNDRPAPEVAVLETIAGFVSLLSEMNVNLNRLAVAAERAATAAELTHELANVDMHATINAGIQAGIEDAVNQRVKEDNKRGWIGK